MADRGFPLSSTVAVAEAPCVFTGVSDYTRYDAYSLTLQIPSSVSAAPTPVYAGFKALLKQRAPDAPVHGLRPSVLRAAATWFVNNFPGTAMYAVKCNPSLIVLRQLHAAGIDTFDVASLPEIEAVRTVAPTATLFFMHPVKSRTAIRVAYFEHGVRHFSLDSQAELQKIIEETNGATDLHLHVRLALPKGEAFHALSQKFGVSEAEAPALMRAAAKVAQVGLCFHVGSQTMSPKPYEDALARVGTLLQKAKVALASLDVGGGFPVAYPGLDPAPMADYMTALGRGLAKLKLPKTCAIYGEPGRALVAEAGSLLVRVELRKDQPKGESALYINDGVYGSLFDTGLMGLMHSVRLHRQNGRRATTKELQGFTLYGPTCDSVDTIKGPYKLPADVQEGDWIEFGQTGSYTMAMQSNFNGFYSDEIVLLSDMPQLLTKGYWS